VRRVPPLFAIAVLLQGCLSARSAIPPAAAIATPSAWRTQLGQGSAVDAQWWRSFGDANLNALVQRALVNNADVDKAAANVAEARARARAARANRGPEIDLTGLGGYTRQLEVIGPVTTWGAEPEATIAYDFDVFGRLASLSAAAKANLLSTKASRDAVALGTASTTAATYIALLGLDDRLRIARETVAARGEELRIQRRLTDRGYSSQLELRQAEAEYHATRDLVPQLALSISQEEDALSVLLGDPPAAIARDTSDLARLKAPEIPAGLPSDLLRRRPDIYAAEETVVAADRSLDASRAEMLPQLALTGNVGGAFATVLPTPESFFLIGGSVLAPIFDSGRRRANADAAAAQRDEAAFAYRSVTLKAFQEVDDALASIQRLEERRQVLTLEAAADAAALKVSAERYQAGYAPYIDQIDAQRGLLSAQLSLSQIETDRLLAYVTLYQAMGGGWSQTASEHSRFLADVVARPAGER
jgi:NodT family efflux transporter outer membrane factor (OMF) lipoprotein